MKSVMMFSPSPTDATSFYRAVGPLQALKKRMNFNLVVGQDVNWATLKSADLVFMQRPFTPNHVKIVDMAKQNGKKVVVDYDDDLFNVPLSNRAYKTYNLQLHQNNIVQILSKADAVMVSTQDLKRKFTEILLNLKKIDSTLPEGLNLEGSKIHVVPNAYDEEFCFYRKAPYKKDQNKLVTWRGSDTHDKDLMQYTPNIVAAFKNHLDWTMNFIGSPFWYTMEELDKIPNIKSTNVIHTDSLDPSEFWRMLWMTSPALVIAPLWDCTFNRAKSNIAWIEGLHAGSVCLAPNWEEWQRPGIINYENHLDFQHKMDSFMRGEFDARKMHNEGWEFLMENLTLQKVNLIREWIFNELWG